MNIGIWGSSGYLGAELLKILSGRKGIEIVFTATSQKSIGTIKDVQIAFLALPTKQSMELVPKLLERGIKVIDLSGAYRLRNPSIYEKYYCFSHLHPDLLKKSVYGLPEINRERIKDAVLIVNPGCYSTAVIFGLLPLIKNKITVPSKVVVKAISGYTGAGKGIKIPKTITSYKGGRQHQHIPEIEQELGLEGKLRFFPQIAPWPRGIEAVINVKIPVNTDLANLYKQFYEIEPFIRVKLKEPKIGDVIGTNFCDIYPRMGNKLAEIKVVIDNLGKGGAGQAVQNFDILCGLEGESLIY